MAKSMVIVESPAKARTIEKYLGKGYLVAACAGHIKDLPKQALGVDVEHDFRPTYRVISDKRKIVEKLKNTASRVKAIYLAADPDREGEAICQHLSEVLSPDRKKQIYRVLFNEITRDAILRAFEKPSSIDEDRVAAQQARRILDRLVGYKVSPLLWRNVRRGLSAGRVQSVALRMVVDRENEIRAFVPEEFWNFTARLQCSQPPPFLAKAVELDGKKFKVSNQKEAEQLLKELKAGEFTVTDVRKKERKQRPLPPFVTSKLQQEAARRLRYSVRKTMVVAQRLYEGVEVGDEGRVGLITYMRTDSTRVSDLALQEVRKLIRESLGEKYLPARAAAYRKKKGAQDAHEAIRPTAAARRPEALKSYLNSDEYRLYDLIWRRFVASQMSPALFDQTEIDVQAPRTLFRAVGSIEKFDGFLRVSRQNRSEKPVKEEDRDGESSILPDVQKGEKLQVLEILHEQKFTQPPARYSEGSLVRALEEKGIGRPSTYAQIISVIQNREYVEKQKGRFVPTDVGDVVSELLVSHFRDLFDYDYTARLEKDLDEIENGKQNWVSTLRRFYDRFSRELDAASEGMKNFKREEKPAGLNCEKCGSPMVIKWGRFGRFIACSNYPECRNTMQLPRDDSQPEVADGNDQQPESCEKCGQPMVLKKGRYGEFYACSGYPECKNTRRLVEVDGKKATLKDELLDEACPKCGSQLAQKHGRFGQFIACSSYPDCRFIKQETTGVACPDCGDGEIVQKKSRRGKVFYSCNAYPKCKFVLWNKPIGSSCPLCGHTYLLERRTKKEGVIHTCGNQECKYKQVVEPPED